MFLPFTREFLGVVIHWITWVESTSTCILRNPASHVIFTSCGTAHNSASRTLHCPIFILNLMIHFSLWSLNISPLVALVDTVQSVLSLIQPSNGSYYLTMTFGFRTLYISWWDCFSTLWDSSTLALIHVILSSCLIDASLNIHALYQFQIFQILQIMVANVTF